MQGADGEQCYVGLTKMFELVDCRCGVLCLWAVAGLSVVQPKLILWPIYVRGIVQLLVIPIERST